ncbi:hypothetical protein IRJ41_006179, partial [Triplophysa rosa]
YQQSAALTLGVVRKTWQGSGQQFSTNCCYFRSDCSHTSPRDSGMLQLNTSSAVSIKFPHITSI